MLEQLGGRKFLYCILITLLSFALVLFKMVPSEDWLELVKFLLATYIVGNVATKLTTTLKDIK